MKLLLILTLTVAGSAEPHRFEAKQFYTTFSGAHPPVLRIKPGDSVVTSTIDARGFDSAGVQRGQGPNPETGPFYIEGAEPGDTLVVHLLRLETNRATGFSASLLAPYTADPGFLRLEAVREPKQATWQVDKQKGIAFMDPGDFKGPRIELPLRPMLGCVATAPPPYPPRSPTTSAATWTTTVWAPARHSCCRCSTWRAVLFGRRPRATGRRRSAGQRH